MIGGVLFRLTAGTVFAYALVASAAAALLGGFAMRGGDLPVSSIGLADRPLPEAAPIDTGQALQTIKGLGLNRSLAVGGNPIDQGGAQAGASVGDDGLPLDLPRISAIVLESGTATAYVVTQGRFGRMGLGDSMNGYELVGLSTSEVVFSDADGDVITQTLFKPIALAKTD
ncbi:MAG: hypothetical protein AAF311_06045 [Pseudomonadota bacterium]